MDNLCNDVLSHIFSFLTTDELIQLRAVSKRWKNEISEQKIQVKCCSDDVERIKQLFPKSEIEPYYVSKVRKITEDWNDMCIYTCRRIDGTYFESEKVPSIIEEHYENGEIDLICKIWLNPFKAINCFSDGTTEVITNEEYIEDLEW